MKKYTIMFAAILAASLLLVDSKVCGARDTTVLFWYPGEAGSTADAQPVLDAFFKYLNTKTAPETARGIYFNDTKEGLKYLKSSKPVAGIISNTAFNLYRNDLGGAKALLATLPLPHGKDTEQYSLMGKADKVAPRAVIYASEPLNSALLLPLFKSLPPDISVIQTNQMFSTLKKIADGSLNAFAVLTPAEADAVAKISAQWVQSLKPVAKSEPMPTARVMLFDQGWKGAEKFKAALLAAGKDPAARDVLTELRLAGFSEVK